MPNWIEGTIKLRGNNKDLQRFFNEGIGPARYFGELQFGTLEKDFSSDECEIVIKDNTYIKNTSRAFIQPTYVYWNTPIATICMPIKQAWGFMADNDYRDSWINISKEFNLDIRLYGFESGMEFCEEIEIIKGEVTIHKITKYDDWMWECPMPLLGG